jgi:hypothetical protein
MLAGSKWPTFQGPSLFLFFTVVQTKVTLRATVSPLVNPSWSLAHCGAQIYKYILFQCLSFVWKLIFKNYVHFVKMLFLLSLCFYFCIQSEITTWGSGDNTFNCLMTTTNEACQILSVKIHHICKFCKNNNEYDDMWNFEGTCVCIMLEQFCT